MPRPKGSKNKKRAATALSLDELIAQKSAQKEELEARFTDLATELKEIKATYKKTEKELNALLGRKAAEDEALAKAEAAKAIREKIDQLIADGKSMEEILGMLN